MAVRVYVCGSVVLRGFVLGQAEGPGVCYLAEFLRRWSRRRSSSGAVVEVVMEEEEEEVAVVFVSGERESELGEWKDAAGRLSSR
jgi:hypothetical protein